MRAVRRETCCSRFFVLFPFFFSCYLCEHGNRSIR
nr:MAG TPA: hypothetical protein [Caudoviricetes sp.]